MKISEARGLCQRFSPERQGGKVLCTYLLADGEFCSLPDKFHCEVMDAIRAEKEAASTPPPVPAVPPEPSPEPSIDESVVLQHAAPTVQEVAAEKDKHVHGRVWSYSRIQTGLRCMRHYFLRYLARAPETDVVKHFVLGRIFHEDRAAVDNDLPLPMRKLPPGLAENDLVRVGAVIQAYQHTKPLKGRIGSSEVRFDLEHHSGVALTGFVDAISPDGKELHEFKFAQDEEAYTPFVVSRQLSVYLAGFPHAEYITVTVAKKPKQKRGKEENLLEFEQRVSRAQSASTFDSRTYQRSSFNVEGELAELAAAAKTIDAQVDAALMAGSPYAVPSCRNTMDCKLGMCSFALFCQISYACYLKKGCRDPDRCVVRDTCMLYRQVWRK